MSDELNEVTQAPNESVEQEVVDSAEDTDLQTAIAQKKHWRKKFEEAQAQLQAQKQTPKKKIVTGKPH